VILVRAIRQEQHMIAFVLQTAVDRF